nr:hypothetical protein [Nocardioides sp. MAH-18]
MTLAALADAESTGEVVVTDDVVLAPDDSEEQEYAALMTAADASAELVAGPGRRVVLVVDVAQEPAVGDRVPRARWAAVHADVEDRPVDADPDDDLGWFGVQEIPHLL